MTMAALRLEGVTITYRRKAIFDRFSHAFAQGCHAILGDNGTGKSTLLGAIAGSVPYEGRILIGGNEITQNRVEARRALAYAPDSAIFYPFVTGGQFADFILHAHDRSPATDRPRYREIVDRLNMRESLDTRFGEASLGTRRKFFLLATLLLETPVLILDEPFNGLDHAASCALIDWLNEPDSARTVLLTCHQPAIVEAIRGARWRLGRAPHSTIDPA